MSIVLDGSVGISSIGTLTGVTSISSTTADTPVILQDSSSNSNTCRAWVNFNGTGTVAIRADFNVSSITDNGTGDYTVNFATAMPDADYAAPFGSIAKGTGNNLTFTCIDFDTAPTTSALRVRTSSTTAYEDRSIITVAIFR